MYFVLLTLYTLIIGYLTWWLYRKTREFSFILGSFLMYYWSLMGAWFILYDDVTNDGGKNFGLHYYHFREILFPVKVDSDYLLTLTLYFTFIAVVLGTLIWFTKGKKVLEQAGEPVRISHAALITVCVLSVAASCFLVWDKILTAAKFNESVYVVVRACPGPGYTLHQVLNLCMVIALYIGFLSLLSGKKAQWITGNNSRLALAGYVICIFLVEGYLLVLGNKKEIFFGGILGAMFYYRNVKGQVQWKSVAIIVSIVMIPMIFNDGLRSYSPKFLTRYFDTEKYTLCLEEPVQYTQYSFKSSSLAFLFSNEMFCAHFSMYGVIDKKVPRTYGSSLVSLGASVVPRFAWPNRPEGIYEYYAKQVGARPGQGYTIHHATAWYLNFGIAGVLAGAFILGWLWSLAYNRANYALQSNKTFVKLIRILSVPVFAAFIPMMMRGGPESYKTLLFEGILIPASIIFISVWVLRLKKQQA